MKSRQILFFATLVAVPALGWSSAQAQSLTIDNFEEYTNGQEIATNASSTPWLRFGAVEDGLYATTTSSQDSTGTLGAQIPVDPAANSGFAITARNYGVATSFSAYSQAKVLSKSLATTTADSLQLYLSDGSTTYVSTTSQAESTTSKTFTFPLNSSAFTDTGGADSFATVLGSATEIGFQITSSTGAGETIAFDDFSVQSTPEPSSACLLFVGIAGLMLQRKRQAQHYDAAV